MNNDELNKEGAVSGKGQVTPNEGSQASELGGYQAPANEGATGESELKDSNPTEQQVNDGIADIAKDEAPAEEAKIELPKAWYRIDGNVDAFDEQGNIVSQYPIGSKQELTVEYGDQCVANGLAERIEE